MNISVITHPNSKRPRVEEDLTGQIHVYVSAPPLEGRANMAVFEALAEHFGVKKKHRHDAFRPQVEDEEI